MALRTGARLPSGVAFCPAQQDILHQASKATKRQQARLLGGEGMDAARCVPIPIPSREEVLLRHPPWLCPLLGGRPYQSRRPPCPAWPRLAVAPHARLASADPLAPLAPRPRPGAPALLPLATRELPLRPALSTTLSARLVRALRRWATLSELAPVHLLDLF